MGWAALVAAVLVPLSYCTAKENAADDDKDKEEKSKKENSTPRRCVVNSKPGPLTVARENGITLETTGRAPDTLEAKLARGSERYGAKAK